MNIIETGLSNKDTFTLMGNDLREITKVWKDEKEFGNSPEVVDIFDGFQANYRALSNGLKFHMGFEMNGKIYRAYDLKGQTFIKQITLGSTLHNGGVYRINFLHGKEGLFAKITTGESFDYHKVVKYIEKNGEGIFSGCCFIDVYDI